MSTHLHHERDPDGIVWLYFDRAGAGANVLTPEILEDFDHRLVQIAQEAPRGLVILSDKPAGFIAGADVHGFAGMRDPALAAAHIRRVHAIFQRLESLAFPSLALIHGYCLGGGLELALACAYRIASDEPETRLGFPEVRLGLFPGYGGTVRSTRLLGALPALEMMLSGRALDARSARRLGLVDLAVPRRQLREAAHRLLQAPPPRHRPRLLRRLPATAPLRPLVAALLARRLAAKAPPEYYPAPYALLGHWRRHAGRPLHLYRSETREVARLISGDTAQNLIRVFLLQERLKSLGDRTTFIPGRAHVVGAGVMGRDIAAWCALQGLQVTLEDLDTAALGRAMKHADGLFRRRLKDPLRVQAALDRFQPDPRGRGVEGADLVIEAIFEDAAAKQALFARLEPRVKPSAVLASNTSSIPLETLAEGLERPGRLLGLHFFNPVARMPLVEVVHTPGTDPEALAQGLACVRHLDRLPLPVRSSPGFLVNRILLPYLLEAVTLVEEGVPAPAVDHAATTFGMPVGPIELADRVGLDICLAVGERLAATLGQALPPLLAGQVRAGRLGRKSGAGFYAWIDGRARKPRSPRGYRVPADLGERLILRLVNEAMACLREGVVADADLVDAGVLFGTGFPPFRGGPLHDARAQGIQAVETRLERRHGHHFHADPGWPGVRPARQGPARCPWTRNTP